MEKTSEVATGANRREFTLALAALAATQLTPEQVRAQGLDPLAVAADALTDMVRSRHGKELTPLQVAAIKQSIYRKQYGAELLKKVKLQNGDEPAFVFQP
jgi:hypothetical protein